MTGAVLRGRCLAGALDAVEAELPVKGRPALLSAVDVHPARPTEGDDLTFERGDARVACVDLRLLREPALLALAEERDVVDGTTDPRGDLANPRQSFTLRRRLHRRGGGRLLDGCRRNR